MDGWMLELRDKKNTWKKAMEWIGLMYNKLLNINLSSVRLSLVVGG